jgi:DNA-binding FadR family transcriptional regulator
MLQAVHQVHRQLVEAIERQDAEECEKTMSNMLKHGEKILKGEI